MGAFEELSPQELRLPQGTIRYREAGSGPPVVLVHGLLTNSLLWADVVPVLSREFRVIAPDWPLGSHAHAMRDGADLTPPGLARVVADALAELGLQDVTLVGNDTGGAVSQLVAVDHPERLGRLVLTPCDAYENFLPPMFRPLQAAGRVPGSIWLIANALRARPAQRLPMAFGWLSKRPLPPRTADAFLRPAQGDAGIRRDLRAILRGIDRRHTLRAAERFGSVGMPVLLAWAPEDRFFPLRHAERMAAAFPHGRLERIEDSYTFVSIDQPARTAELIGAFAREAVAPTGS